MDVRYRRGEGVSFPAVAAVSASSVLLLSQVDVAGPAGSIVSTAHDMTKWMLFHLSRGRRSVDGDTKSMFNHQQRLIDTYTEQNAASGRQLNDRGGLFRPKSPVSDVHIAYALGWMTNYYRGTLTQ